jgi:hypothetical protein
MALHHDEEEVSTIGVPSTQARADPVLPNCPSGEGIIASLLSR